MSAPPTDPLDVVLRAFGMTPLRAGIIRSVRQRGAATAQDLIADLQVSRAALVPHTHALVTAGILVQRSDPQMAGARAGFNRLLWSVDQDTLRTHLGVLVREILGEDL